MAIVKLSDITITDVKSYFNYTDKDGPNRDAQITAALPLAIYFIKEYCQSDFEVKDRTETLNAPDDTSFVLYLKYRPVTAFTSVVEDGTTLVKDTDYWCDLNAGYIEKLQSNNVVIFNKGPYWTIKRNAIIATYTGGQLLTQDVVIAFYEIIGMITSINQKQFADIEGNVKSMTFDKIPQDYLNILNRHRQDFRI
jgi:hypothetical protein